MEQIASLVERIKSLKAIAASMREGAFHTQLIPEIDKILALPDDLSTATVGEREAVARQLREYEQTLDRLGYTLLEQLMPTIGVSPVFQIVQAADEFKARLRPQVGRTFTLDGKQTRLEQHHVDVLCRYSLSIGTPPVTDAMRGLVGRLVFGKEVARLYDFVDVLAADPVLLRELFDLLGALVDSSLHYNTVAEETAFLEEASDFPNFEGGRILNRVVVTESPERVIQLIQDHVFDKVTPGGATPVELVETIDGLDEGLIARMHRAPNRVFVVRVTRLPHWLLQPARGENPWRNVLGRLVLIDWSERARATNTTIVHTLFPHVARTLRNVQTSLAGRPANTQLQLRRIIERFPPETLAAIGRALDHHIEFVAADGFRGASIDELRERETLRGGLLDYLTLVKLRRIVRFLERVTTDAEPERLALGVALREKVAADWMRYFYAGLPADRYHVTVLPGGGRGALSLVGDYHRSRVGEATAAFRRDHLAASLTRLADLKEQLQIPGSSTDEIQAAIKVSQLRSSTPSQLPSPTTTATTLPQHLARSVVYRAVDVARRVTRRAQVSLERASFGNLRGGAAAYVKRAMSEAGFGALHGRLEDLVGARVEQVDQALRRGLVPVAGALRAVQRATDEVRGELDPLALADIEAMLKSIEQGAFYPTLILPALSWTYEDVFPEKHYPRRWTIRVPLNARHEMDPLALLSRLEELRYLLRPFPEVFRLCCRSMLLVVNSPHNPTGVVYRRETILRLLQLAAEYDVTVVDDNSYHKLIASPIKAREGEECVAQVYEKHRDVLTRPVRILTVGATTKGLQGSGDRTGILHANDPDAVAFAEAHASGPHLMSLYVTALKLESGRAVKRWTAELERVAAAMLDPRRAEPAAKRLRRLLEAELARVDEEGFPVALFETALAGYEELLRLAQRGATVADLSRYVSGLVKRIKLLRPERMLRADVEKRFAAVREARERAWPAAREIRPQGAFYYCVQLTSPDDERGIPEFLAALSRHRKVDVTYAGQGYVRLSLGGAIAGDERSYRRLGQVVEVYLRLLERSWREFEARGRDVGALDALFGAGEGALDRTLADLAPLLEIHPRAEVRPRGQPLTPDERGLIYCIEEGRSVADKVFIEQAVCQTVPELLASRAFRVVYRRMLRKVVRRHPALVDLTFAQVENQYGPHACQTAYVDRQLMDDVFRALVRDMYETWHGGSTIKVLAAKLDAPQHAEKVAALHGANRRIHELVNELMHAFEVPDAAIRQEGTFDVGYESLHGLRAHVSLPGYMKRIVEGCAFAGATTALNARPMVVTGADRRVSDPPYNFLRRDAGDEASARTSPPVEWFTRRLDLLAEVTDLGQYVCKAVQVGPFKLLLVIHKSYFHLVSDEIRLFPQLEAVQLESNLEGLCWDGALLFGVPAKALGESYKVGYVLDHRADGSLFPVAWVAREDATDYVGFLKKSLLTLHNELVKALGGMPVHGAMITITFKNGLRKTLVFSADSGTGKSETITAMMEQIIGGTGPAAELRRIDILASDMLSLWRGEDRQVYAFGTETGDFLRLNDITESWKAHFGDLLKRGSFSNVDHPKNARVTIGGICDVRKILAPTRVNGFFYINNYEPTRGSSVELSDDPDRVLKHVLVRGLRKNKGTSGDQPSLRAGLEFAGETALVVRFRHAIDESLDWQPRLVEGKPRTCLVVRDGASDVYAARDLVGQAFRRRSFEREGQPHRITGVDFDVLRNVFVVETDTGARRPLERDVYDQIYEPLTSTFCGNPFVDPRGLDRTLEVFAETMRAAKVHTGVIRTQLAREGYEFAGPARSAEDIVAFLLEDEEVNARFQRNKSKVHEAMRVAYGGVIEAGGNLPVELEGYNLLLLEAHESTHVAFEDLGGGRFTLATPHYRLETRKGPSGTFAPAIALPETLAVIDDICASADYRVDVKGLEIDLGVYDRITYWNSLAELTYQVLLVHGVVNLGSSDTEVARFPVEVRKARHIAERIAHTRAEHRPAAPAASEPVPVVVR